MTPIQRRACLSLRRITFGHFPTGARRFVASMIDVAGQDRWQSIELSAKQLAAIARTLRRFRRQVNDPNILFWAQRILVELSTNPQLEEACQQS
jgi:hypothetical protein